MIESHVECSSNVKTFNISSQGYDDQGMTYVR